jgi:hypothetical protein
MFCWKRSLLLMSVLALGACAGLAPVGGPADSPQDNQPPVADGPPIDTTLGQINVAPNQFANKRVRFRAAFAMIAPMSPMPNTKMIGLTTTYEPGKCEPGAMVNVQVFAPEAVVLPIADARMGAVLDIVAIVRMGGSNFPGSQMYAHG